MQFLAFSLVAAVLVTYALMRARAAREAMRSGPRRAGPKDTQLPRRMVFRNMTGKGGLKAVEDPREAATILMLEIARARGELTSRQEAAIRAEIMRHFEFDAADAERLAAQADWLAHDPGTPHSIVARMTDYLIRSPGMTGQRMVALDDMLVYVSEAEGSPTREQLDLLSMFRRKAGLRV